MGLSGGDSRGERLISAHRAIRSPSQSQRPWFRRQTGCRPNGPTIRASSGTWTFPLDHRPATLWHTGRGPQQDNRSGDQTDEGHKAQNGREKHPHPLDRG